MRAYYFSNPSRVTDEPVLICSGTERECRREAACALGQRNLRGLLQSPTAEGVAYYEPGGGDNAAYVELVY